MKMKNGRIAEQPEKGRTYVSQADIPSVSLDRATRVAGTIGENYGYKPSTPLQVAKALGVQPSTGGFRMLTGASIAYGLTAGGYNADAIAITPLGMRIVRPTAEGDDLAAKREALLRPRIIREFLKKYDGAPIPRESIAQNVLTEMGVPQERSAEVLKLILEGASSVGFLQKIKDRSYVELNSTPVPRSVDNGDEEPDLDEGARAQTLQTRLPQEPDASVRLSTVTRQGTDVLNRRVFITHGKNRNLIEPIKKLLTFGELEAVVSVQTQTVSQPVPGKVMEDMRSCGAAIIHVEDERRLVDSDGNEHVVLNDNVLIEIGAAMALFGQRFILVVKDGVKLPSNLQGLLVLSYKGDTLDMEGTIRLLEAVNDMKKRPLPQ
jgi:predicted nucleotide-binding protein